MRSLAVCLSALCVGAVFGNRLGASEPAMIESSALRFSLSPETGQYELLDKQAAVVWRSNPQQARFGEVTLNTAGGRRSTPLARCEVKRLGENLQAEFRPLAEQPDATLRVTVKLPAPSVLEFTYQADPALAVESVRLLDDALWTTDQGGGCVVVPAREGLMVPADNGAAFTHRFGTFEYEGCHMEMFGVVRGGAAALITWHDPYVTLELKSVLTNAPWLEGRQALLPSLSLRKTARSFRLQLLGKGDYVSIARAYRPVAREKGWLVTWNEKLEGHPDRARYFGASNFKLWSMLTRQMNEESTREQSVKVNWTFEEAGQVAEHLKNDLRLDKVLFILGGWIHRGYDNQHPDILPTAPECGGDAAFREACRRIRAQGYLLSLHDNYQDIYRDAPSWNEDYVNKNAAGALTVGGKWAGGRAYITCAQKAVELAKRPQNLASIKKLSEADSYFIDTTYASGLIECFDRNHPLNKWDDMKWKQAISDYAREVFGSFGSECGREWAIPHSDFFEGLTGVSGAYYHNKDLLRQLGAVVVPLFEIAYRDCIALYGKYEYDPMQAAEYVLHHLVIGRPLHYHDVPSHLYWKPPRPESRPSAGPTAVAGSKQPARSPVERGLFCRADGGWAEGLHPLDRFLKNTHEILSPLNEITSRLPMTGHAFLTPDRKVQRSVFGDGREAVVVVANMGTNDYRHASPQGGRIVLPPFGFVVESDRFVAFHALNWAGLDYERPPLFALRSLDGQALAASRQVRVFHGFGDPRVNLGGHAHRVPKEAVVDPAKPNPE
jgi:hypothetical protein